METIAKTVETTELGSSVSDVAIIAANENEAALLFVVNEEVKAEVDAIIRAAEGVTLKKAASLAQYHELNAQWVQEIKLIWSGWTERKTRQPPPTLDEACTIWDKMEKWATKYVERRAEESGVDMVPAGNLANEYWPHDHIRCLQGWAVNDVPGFEEIVARLMELGYPEDQARHDALYLNG